MHGVVRAHGQGLAQGLIGSGRAHGECDDLVAGISVIVAQAQGLFDGVLVDLVDDVIHRGAVQGVVRLEGLR